ncbi:MAG: hypothetical protein KF802_02480 [Bdellovibrionaceae bacterium]|nr:hypothetical protein [Pseudobdellovibrionaceae bacterium]
MLAFLFSVLILVLFLLDSYFHANPKPFTCGGLLVKWANKDEEISFYKSFYERAWKNFYRYVWLGFLVFFIQFVVNQNQAPKEASVKPPVACEKNE